MTSHYHFLYLFRGSLVKDILAHAIQNFKKNDIYAHNYKEGGIISCRTYHIIKAVYFTSKNISQAYALNDIKAANFEWDLEQNRVLSGSGLWRKQLCHIGLVICQNLWAVEADMWSLWQVLVNNNAGHQRSGIRQHHLLKTSPWNINVGLQVTIILKF